MKSWKVLLAIALAIFAISLFIVSPDPKIQREMMLSHQRKIGFLTYFF